jgi:hypothetical protein
MRKDLGVAHDVYIQRGCLVWEDFLFFSLYWFSYIARNSTTLEITLTLVLGLIPGYQFRVQLSDINITCARLRLLHFLSQQLLLLIFCTLWLCSIELVLQSSIWYTVCRCSSPDRHQSKMKRHFKHSKHLEI